MVIWSLSIHIVNLRVSLWIYMEEENMDPTNNQSQYLIHQALSLRTRNRQDTHNVQGMKRTYTCVVKTRESMWDPHEGKIEKRQIHGTQRSTCGKHCNSFIYLVFILFEEM